MSIEQRFKERTTYFILLGSVLLSFSISVTLGAFLYYQSLEFWEGATQCIVDRNFDCLLDSISYQSLFNAEAATFIAYIVSINGIIASLAFLILFKQKER